MHLIKKNNKGFTLTELIIVIVIIGILSTVLITSITGYITKAKKSNDSQLAAQMSREMRNYCIENDINQKEITGINIRTILSAKGFNLVPSTNKWTYVYSVSEEKIVVREFNDGVLADGVGRKDLTEVITGFYLLGKGKTVIEEAVGLLTIGDVNGFLAKLESGSYTEYNGFITNTYSYDKVLYINASGIVNPTAISNGFYEKVILCEKTNFIPNIVINDDYSDKLNNNTEVMNKNILFIVAGSGNLKDSLNVNTKKTVELEKLGSTVRAIKPNNLTEEKFNMKMNLSFPLVGDERIDDLFTQDQILSMSFVFGDNVKKANYITTSFSKVNNIGNIWKMSVMFTNDKGVIGYKEIFFTRPIADPITE